MESLANTLGSIRNSVAAAFTAATTTQTTEFTRSDVNKLEEHERARRMEQASQAQLDKDNAASVSSIIKTQSFPVFRGNVSRGYKRHTTRFEEEERRRRLTNKSESALRRNNANQTARMIQKLGWPFFQGNRSGPEYITMDPTKLLEEEERAWRTNDAFWAPTAKHNAAMVANILRWGSFQKNPKAGYSHHVARMQEKERKLRLHPDYQHLAIDNAYNQAGLIRNMGEPFYVQKPLAKRDLSFQHKIDELERKNRIKAGGNMMARELAQASENNDPEEQERVRRLQDLETQKLAKENAKQVSLMVRESSFNKLNEKAPMWFSISRNSMKALEEIERTRRLRDNEGQDLAKQHAKSLSDIITHKWSLPPKRNTNTIEEEERQNRILDRAQQQLAVKNARKVSGMVARHNLLSAGSKSFALAMEESERSRRLQDNEQQSLARNNAKKVSSLFSSLNVAPGHHVEAAPLTKDISSAPFTQISSVTPTESLPTYSAPITKEFATGALSPVNISSVFPTESLPTYNAPTTVAPSVLPTESISSVPLSKVSAAPSLAPTIVAPSVLPTEALPTYSAPVAASPITVSIPVTPVTAAPVTSTPVFSAPITKSLPATPISSVPIVKSLPATPISSAPVSSAPIFSAPISSAPISSAPISSAPVSSAPIFSAPISSLPVAASSIPRSSGSESPLVAAAPSVTRSISTTPVSSVPVSSYTSAPVSSYTSAPLSSSTVPLSSSTAPISSSIQPLVIPSTSAYVPVAPLATAERSIPTVHSSAMPVRQASATNVNVSTFPSSSSFTTPTVPIDSLSIAHPALGERQRKKLAKQATRHNRKSEKDVRKAEHQMLKAEKLHQKGRDDKALKLEAKAENLMKAAEYERRWASGIQSELAPNAPAPASM